MMKLKQRVYQGSDVPCFQGLQACVHTGVISLKLLCQQAQGNYVLK